VSSAFLRRLQVQVVTLLVILLAATALTFIITNVLPGDAAVAILGDNATPADIATLIDDLESLEAALANIASADAALFGRPPAPASAHFTLPAAQDPSDTASPTAHQLAELEHAVAHAEPRPIPAQARVELGLPTQGVLDDAGDEPPEHVAVAGDEARRPRQDVEHRLVQEVVGVAVLPQAVAETQPHPRADPRHVALHQFVQGFALPGVPTPQQRLGVVVGRRGSWDGFRLGHRRRGWPTRKVRADDPTALGTGQPGRAAALPASGPRAGTERAHVH
jgi:hypothetical protein